MWRVELLGGPRDGEVLQISERLPQIRFPTMASSVTEMWAADEKEPKAIGMDVLTYEALNRISHLGHWLYRYVP
jgi:hypothetical protein